MNKSANQIATHLRSLGYQIGKVSEPDDVVDGEIEILNSNYHVQVGFDYYFLTECFYKEDDSLDSVRHFDKVNTICEIHCYIQEQSNLKGEYDGTSN